MSGDFGPLASAPLRLTRISAAWSDGDGNCHAHGRWIGLFKLAEEAGETIVAAADLILIGGSLEGAPEFVRALENELADLGAASLHAIEANRLDSARVGGRVARQIRYLSERADRQGRWIGLLCLVRACGALQQLLGKIAAFPQGDEHPDGFGNLLGRLEVAIADATAAAQVVTEANGLDRDHIQLRGDDKLERFRDWFPAPPGEVAP